MVSYCHAGVYFFQGNFFLNLKNYFKIFIDKSCPMHYYKSEHKFGSVKGEKNGQKSKAKGH